MDDSPPRIEPNEKVRTRGGQRVGAGRKTLQEKNLVTLQTRLSLPPEILKKLDFYTTWRDGNEKKFPERHRGELIRDILTCVFTLIETTGLDELDQAILTKNLKEILELKEGYDHGKSGQ